MESEATTPTPKKTPTDLLKEQGNIIQDGAKDTAGRVKDWVTEPDDAASVMKRTAAVLAWLVLWVMGLSTDMLTVLPLTVFGLVAVFLVNGLRMRRSAGKPSGEPVSAPEEPRETVPVGGGEQDSPKAPDDFWTQHTPQVVEKTRVDTHSDGLLSEMPTVRLRPREGHGPVDLKKTQVIDVSGVRTAVRDGGSYVSDTGHKVQKDHVSTYPASEVSGQLSGGVSGVSEPQVSGVSEVSGQLGQAVEKDMTNVTEREITTEDAKPVSLAKTSPQHTDTDLVRMSTREGLSVREISLRTGIPRSSVQDRLSKARREEERREILQAVSPPPRTVPQVVLPGAWHGEDGHAQEVRFLEGCAEAPQDEATVSALGFIRDAFLGSAATTEKNWVVDLGSGFIRGEIPDQRVLFSGCWTETGTVVINRVVFQ